MYYNLKLKAMLSCAFFFLFMAGFSQDETKKQSIGDVVYSEYKENGIEPALTRYNALKTKEASKYDWNEWELNRIGYKIMMEDSDMSAAEKIFSLNMKEYPQAANPRDSYADYLIENNDMEGAKKYLKESISLAEKSNNEDEKTRILGFSKSKLAKLENKHKQLDFMLGNWELESTVFQNGEEAGKEKGYDETTYDEKSSLITINHKNESGEIVGKRMLVYDAMEEGFDMIYINTAAPMGIENSFLKVKDLGNNNYELMETTTNLKGDKKKMKHEIKKVADNKIDWVIFEGNENDANWTKVYAMNLNKD